MKKIILLNAVVLMSVVGFSQTNFKWEKVDSVAKTKAQIYSDTKMFIAGTWVTASTETNGGAVAVQIITGNGQGTQNQPPDKHTIQNDDKEAGSILVSGEMEFNSFFTMNWHKYRYSYTVNFLMKEGKYKVVIDNVHCIYAHCANYDWPLIEPCDESNCPKYGKTGFPVERLLELMGTLKGNLQGIVDNYDAYIKKPSVSKDDW